MIRLFMDSLMIVLFLEILDSQLENNFKFDYSF